MVQRWAAQSWMVMASLLPFTWIQVSFIKISKSFSDRVKEDTRLTTTTAENDQVLELFGIFCFVFCFIAGLPFYLYIS